MNIYYTSSGPVIQPKSIKSCTKQYQSIFNFRLTSMCQKPYFKYLTDLVVFLMFCLKFCHPMLMELSISSCVILDISMTNVRVVIPLMFQISMLFRKYTVSVF